MNKGNNMNIESLNNGLDSLLNKISVLDCEILLTLNDISNIRKRLDRIREELENIKIAK